MRIDNKKEIKDFIYSLNDVNELNMSLSEMFLSIINNKEITTKEELETLSKTYSKSIRDIYFDKILEYWDIDSDNPDNQNIIDNYIYPNFLEADTNLFRKNKYYQTIKIKDVNANGFSLINDSYDPYEIFALDDINVDDNYVENSKLAFFKKQFSFIALNHKDVTWMSITPNEIITMEKHINKAHGNIVVFGLGLGYFPFMCALKEEVKSITIIENDRQIIDIFQKYLFPQFINQEKIRIVNSDAFDVIKKELHYDFAFVDLWHNAEDGIKPFLQFKSIEKDNPNTTFAYWLDNSFYAFLRRCFISLLMEQLEGQNDNNYKKAGNSFDEIINKMYFKTKNLHISNASEIEELLSDDKLLEIIL